MKKILTAIVMAIFIIYPPICFASYIIHLKDGREFVTDRYWEEGEQIKFKRYGGVIGIERDLVRGIEEIKDLPDENKAVKPKDGEKPEVPEKTGKEKKVKKQGETEKGLQGIKGVESAIDVGEQAINDKPQPEGIKDKLPSTGNAKNKKLIDKFMKEFMLFEQRFRNVHIMNDEELYKFAKDLTIFKKGVLTNRLGHIFAKQLLETYSMGDEIEAILKWRAH